MKRERDERRRIFKSDGSIRDTQLKVSFLIHLSLWNIQKVTGKNHLCKKKMVMRFPHEKSSLQMVAFNEIIWNHCDFFSQKKHFGLGLNFSIKGKRNLHLRNRFFFFFFFSTEKKVKFNVIYSHLIFCKGYEFEASGKSGSDHRGSNNGSCKMGRGMRQLNFNFQKMNLCMIKIY